MFQCDKCDKAFEKILSLNAHKRVHSKLPLRYVSGSEARSKKLQEVYYKSPKICLTCNKALSYNLRRGKFCNNSCAAQINNANPSVERLQKKTATMKNTMKQKFPKKTNVIGPFCKIVRNVCSVTSIVFFSATYQKYHPSLKSSKEYYYRQCQFDFPLNAYPNYFAEGIKLLKEFGMYSTLGKHRKGLDNPNGVSRDHMVSISYGFKHNIDPDIIKHPANCRVILHKDNNQKNVKCCLTLDELLIRIEEWQDDSATI